MTDFKWMEYFDWKKDVDWETVLSFNRSMSRRLDRQTGNAWKEIIGELHSHYLQSVFWILMFEDDDVQQVHSVFKSIVADYIPDLQPVQICVSYTILAPPVEINFGSLSGSLQIINGENFLGPIGSNPSSKPYVFHDRFFLALDSG